MEAREAPELQGPRKAINPLDLVGLGPLMRLTSGTDSIRVALIDGPVASHPDLSPNFRFAPAGINDAAFAQHGTFIAGVLAARRGGIAPGICPDCVVESQPLFKGAGTLEGLRATVQELANAVVESVDRGASVVNLSLAVSVLTTQAAPTLDRALDHAASRGCMIVAAAGNQGLLGSSPITRHPWVIPVAAYDLARRPAVQSTLGASLGRHGLGGPGSGVVSLSSTDGYVEGGGTSVATAFVTGAVALLRSIFPSTPAAVVRRCLLDSARTRQDTVVPPLLNAWRAHHALGQVQWLTSQRWEERHESRSPFAALGADPGLFDRRGYWSW